MIKTHMNIRKSIVNLFLKIYQPKKMGTIEKFIRDVIFYDKFIVVWYKDIISNPKLQYISGQDDIESYAVIEYVNNNEPDKINTEKELKNDK